eukprot:7380887-Prymnesium_polylepis.1
MNEGRVSSCHRVRRKRAGHAHAPSRSRRHCHTCGAAEIRSDALSLHTCKITTFHGATRGGAQKVMVAKIVQLSSSIYPMPAPHAQSSQRYRKSTPQGYSTRVLIVTVRLLLFWLHAKGPTRSALAALRI